MRNYKYWDSYNSIKEMLATIPLGFEFVQLLKYSFTPDSNFPHFGIHLTNWVREIENCDVDWCPLEGKRLLLVTLPGWSHFDIPIALFFAARRCRVDVAYYPFCRYDRSETLAERKEIKYKYVDYFKSGIHPFLRFVNLSNCGIEKPTQEMVEECKMQSEIDSRMALKKEELDCRRKARDRKTFRFRFQRNLDCMKKMLFLLGSNRYDAIIVANGNWCELGITFRLAKILGANVVCYEFGERADIMIISKGRPCTALDTSAEWEADYPHQPSEEAKSRIASLMKMRQGTNWDGFVWSVQKGKFDGSRERIIEKLHLANDKLIALMTPNVPWDSSLVERNIIFPSLVQWVRETVSFLARRSDLQVVIRIHPAEKMIGTGEPLEGIIKQVCPSIPKNFRIIAADNPTNTYDLMNICDFGLVYNSTTGMEMAMRGIPVLCAGSPHYGKKGFTIHPSDKKNYFEMLEKMLTTPKGTRLSQREIDLAWCYADIYFNKWAKPFPWGVRPFVTNIKEWPLSRVLSKEGLARFKDSFDLFLSEVS